ncbi:hypothetical protein [Fastidiosibacter lacustris]|uniref:hypothetical protein n=1 Tax=Fastidiosibacter lacustris TaxID=2056695 RepID=UPI000E34302D|nr:hypothetical protein [Fastidiosibacter lacustris]
MIKYQLKENGGNNNNDCLIIAIGRLANPNLSEQAAVVKGWQAVFDGVNTMETDALKMLYTELKGAYVEDIDNINNYFSLDFNDDKTIESFETELKKTFGDNDLSSEIMQDQLHDKVKQEVTGFLRHLQEQVNLQKYVELLKIIPEDKKQNLMLVSKNDLDSHPGQVYEKFRDLIIAGKVPHFLVHNGAHYSNIVPTAIDYNEYDQAIDPEPLIKKAFVDLMNNALVDAAGFTHPEVLTQLGNDDLNLPPYTLQTLENDLKFEQDMRQAKEESNTLSANIQKNQIDVKQAIPVQSDIDKLSKLLEFVNDNIDQQYLNNTRYTYQLQYKGHTYSVPWSLMQAYDPRKLGSYDENRILQGLKEDLEKENAAEVISQKLRAPMYGTIWNNTYGVTNQYLNSLVNASQFNEVIMTADEKKETYQSYFLNELSEILLDNQKMIDALVALEVFRSNTGEKLDNSAIKAGLEGLNTANLFDYQTIADNYKLDSSISAEALNQYGVKSNSWSEAQQLFIGTAITCAAEKTLQRFLPQGSEINSENDFKKLEYLKPTGGLYQDLAKNPIYQDIIQSAKNNWAVEKDNEFSLFNPKNQEYLQDLANNNL